MYSLLIIITSALLLNNALDNCVANIFISSKVLILFGIAWSITSLNPSNESSFISMFLLCLSILGNNLMLGHLIILDNKLLR